MLFENYFYTCLSLLASPRAEPRAVLFEHWTFELEMKVQEVFTITEKVPIKAQLCSLVPKP